MIGAFEEVLTAADRGLDEASGPPAPAPGRRPEFYP